MRRARQQEERGPERQKAPEPEPPAGAAAQPPAGQSRVLHLHQSLGNRAVQRLLRKASGSGSGTGGAVGEAYRQSGGEAAAPLAVRGKSAGEPLAPGLAGAASRALGTDLSGVRVHADAHADSVAREVNAEAFTVGRDVFFRGGNHAPSSIEGRGLLDHELAHVAQYQKGQLAQPERALEDQADRAAGGASTFADGLPPAVPAAPRLLRHPSPTCTRIELTLPSTIVFYGTAGPISLSVEIVDIPEGSYTARYDPSHGGSLVLDALQGKGLVLRVSGSIRGTKAEIKARQQNFQAYLDGLASSPVTLRAVGSGSAAGTGTVGGGEPGGGTGTKTKTGTGGTGAGGTPQGKTDDTGSPGGTPGGTGKGGTGGHKDPGAGSGGDPGTSPSPQMGSHGPIVRIDDIKQIDELKRRGVLDDKTADSIKDKSAKQEELSFDEAIALLDALSQTMVAHPAGDKKTKTGSNWVEMARLIKANRDKFSGQQATGPDGMSLDEMKQILAKYHEFVGVKDAPKPGEPATPQERIEKFDPQKRKSWNTLRDWEKDIWKKYQAKYGDPAMETSVTDLHLTPQVKFRLALSMSPSFMKEGAREAADALFHDPIFIAGTILGIAIWVAAWLAPEPLFSKAFAATITIAMLAVFSVSEIRNVAVAWMRLEDESEDAKTFDDLELAAKHFGEAMGGVGLRVLVMLATIVAGKAIPGAKGGGGGGGGGGLTPAPAGGVPVAAAVAEATEIKVLADGTIVILGTRGGAISQSTMGSQGGGGGGAPKQPAGGQTPVKEEPRAEKVTVEEEQPPHETHQIKAPSRWGPDVEQQQGVGKQVGNFAHKWFERLRQFLPSNRVGPDGKEVPLVSEQVNPGLEAEYRIKNPSYKDPRTAPRIDRLNRAGRTVIEFKPHGLYEEGLAEAKAYAQEMDKYEPLPNNERWQAECITYDFEAVLQHMEDIGYLTHDEVAAFRAKAKK